MEIPLMQIEEDLRDILKAIALANVKINDIFQNRGRYELREVDKIQLRRWKSVKAVNQRALDELTHLLNL